MKRIIVLLALLMLLSGCVDTPVRETCPRCWETEVLSGSCPCCGVDMCVYCAADADYELSHSREHAFEEGSQDGYEIGYREGYDIGYFEWFDEVYHSGAVDGYGQGYADALRGHEYALDPADGFVWVAEGADMFHKHECDVITENTGNTDFYWFEEALVLGYQYCPDCIGK